jgi:hypothetical protein
MAPGMFHQQSVIVIIHQIKQLITQIASSIFAESGYFLLHVAVFSISARNFPVEP